MTSPFYDIEQVVLGVLIERPDLIPATFNRLPPVEFTGPHSIIAEALQTMSDLAEPINVTTLLERLHRTGLLVRAGGGAALHTLIESAWRVGEADTLIDALEGQALRRKIRGIGMRIVQRTENVTIEPEEVLQAAREELADVQATTGRVETIGWPTGDVDPEPEWVIPNLLGTDERVMITGGEGLGKSMLIRQLVASVAVGRHPFTFAAFTPQPALHVDLENPRSISDAAYRRIRNGLIGAGIEVPDLLHRLEPRVFDVENSTDVAWLMRAVRAVQPRLIAIGPLKNMTSGDLNEEKAAMRVQITLNRIRAETGACLVVEAHAGHVSRGEGGDWRVRGNSSLLGWPEEGFGMKPVRIDPPREAQLVKWRGSRTVGRHWPEHLVQGDPWPWSNDPRAEGRG